MSTLDSSNQSPEATPLAPATSVVPAPETVDVAASAQGVLAPDASPSAVAIAQLVTAPAVSQALPPVALKLEAVAICNHRVAIVFWSTTAKIPDCLGFSVRRIDSATGEKTALPAWVPFKGGNNDTWTAKTTDEYPVQAFTWKDFRAKEGQTYKYEVVPMCGTPGNLTARNDLAVITNEVTLTDTFGDIQVRFTGILATQGIAHLLPELPDGTLDPAKIITAINTPNSPLRNKLSGGLPGMIVNMFDRAKAIGGRLIAYNYELSDPEVLDTILANPALISLILSNTGKDDFTNAPGRAKLHAAGVDITDRMLPDWGIGHNKFIVLLDKDGKPVAVLTGSTNFTPTGFCTQSNNMLVIDSPELAQLFVDYWHLVKADTDSGAILRTANAIRKTPVVLPDGTKITVWFAPNTKEQTKSRTPAEPPDLAEVFRLMEAADEGIFALAFYPGAPSILHKMSSINQTGKKIIMRGAVSSGQALRGIPRMVPRKGSQQVMVVATGLEQKLAAFHKELLKLPEAHAIIHSKLMVLFSRGKWIIITGSHNLGFKASYSNDENLLVIENNRPLAMAYLANVLDVFGHYRFRSIQTGGAKKWDGFLSSTDTWQDRHMVGAAREEMEMWPKFVLTV